MVQDLAVQRMRCFRSVCVTWGTACGLRTILVNLVISIWHKIHDLNSQIAAPLMTLGQALTQYATSRVKSRDRLLGLCEPGVQVLKAVLDRDWSVMMIIAERLNMNSMTLRWRRGGWLSPLGYIGN